MGTKVQDWCEIDPRVAWTTWFPLKFGPQLDFPYLATVCISVLCRKSVTIMDAASAGSVYATSLASISLVVLNAKTVLYVPVRVEKGKAAWAAGTSRQGLWSRMETRSTTPNVHRNARSIQWILWNKYQVRNQPLYADCRLHTRA